MKKLSILVAVATGAFANLLELQAQLPECSLQCIAEGAAKFGCSITDISCQCSQLQAMTKEVAPCLAQEGCDMEQITGKLFFFVT